MRRICIFLLFVTTYTSSVYSQTSEIEKLEFLRKLVNFNRFEALAFSYETIISLELDREYEKYRTALAEATPGHSLEQPQKDYLKLDGSIFDVTQRGQFFSIKGVHPLEYSFRWDGNLATRWTRKDGRASGMVSVVESDIRPPTSPLPFFVNVPIWQRNTNFGYGTFEDVVQGLYLKKVGSTFVIKNDDKFLRFRASFPNGGGQEGGKKYATYDTYIAITLDTTQDLALSTVEEGRTILGFDYKRSSTAYSDYKKLAEGITIPTTAVSKRFYSLSTLKDSKIVVDSFEIGNLEIRLKDLELIHGNEELDFSPNFPKGCDVFDYVTGSNFVAGQSREDLGNEVEKLRE